MQADTRSYLVRGASSAARDNTLSSTPKIRVPLTTLPWAMISIFEPRRGIRVRDLLRRCAAPALGRQAQAFGGPLDLRKHHTDSGGQPYPIPVSVQHIRA